ncbi:hypothetical protein GcM1_141001 [Golovinomyces cichoracearum]|uniref:Myb/SANT-like domain-containing protein n=1 Tax=Golovinomyces cichoracearum TaxID=62708 RepID=A0A420JBL4_9PEZI|nr:hypothetical protein GcM1_141001 [Golovinomyces cichoracearum]
MPSGSSQDSVDNLTSTPLKLKRRSSFSTTEFFSIIEQLLEAKRHGNISDNGFKKTVWQSMAESFIDPLKTRRECELNLSRIKAD